MDLRAEDELMLKQKLSKTAKKIRKNRKNFNKIIKEVQEFQEIKELLNISDVLEEEEEAAGEDVTVETYDSLVSCTAPITAPGIEIFQEENVFWLFNEETLCLEDFLVENERFNVFGEDAEVPKEDLFRDLIAHHITETILPDNEKCHSISLYVLYLMSVHTDKYFVCACSDFLKYRRFEISAAEILPIFFNFGTSSRVLLASEFPVELPRNVDRSTNGRTGGNGFPYYNAEMVGNIILHYAALDLIKREPHAKLLLKAFTRLILDWKIRSSRLFSVYSSLISILSSQFVETLGIDNVVSCLHLEEEDILNQVEIARLVLMPVSSTLHKALIIHTINFILKSQVLKISDSLKVQDVLKVLKKLKRRELTPLEVYCILQLINGSLPSATARAKQVGDINSALISLEAGFFNAKDSVDVIRLKLEIAKLRNLVTNSADNALSMGYLDASCLSQVGKRK